MATAMARAMAKMSRAINGHLRMIFRHPRVLHKLSDIIIVVSLITASPMLWAGEWRFTPRVTKQETFSDNINQASSSAAHSDYVTQVTPGIGITGTGAKLSMNFDYAVDLLHYLHGTSSNSIDHRLQTSANAELLDEFLFLDLNASAGQQNTSSTGTLATDNLTVSSNTSNFLTYDISPFLRHRLGKYADSEIRYRRQQANNGGGFDTEVNTMSLNLSSGRFFSSLPWTVSATESKNSNSDNTSSTFRNVDTSVRYNFSRRYGVRLNVGYEDNDISSTRGSTRGLTWGLTGTWTPTPRTNFEAGYESRFFGNNFNILATHRMRRSIFNLSYSVDATTSANQQLESTLFPLVDAFGEPIVNPGVNDPNIPINRVSIGSDVIITTRLDAGLNMRGRRSNYGISIFNEERDFESGAGSEQVYGMRASASRTLSRRNSANIGFNWQINQQASNVEDTQWDINLGYTHTFSQEISTSMNYRHSENSSTGPGSGFKENRISANLNWLF